MTLGWGILGTGDIARQFAEDIRHAADAALLAVGSRRLETAEAFAGLHDVPRAYASYEALLADPDIGAVYVATPHPFHFECVMACIDAGKAVLCEKPLGMNAAQTAAMIDAAHEKGVFLMEGVWSLFFPAMAKVRELIATGAIGTVRMMRADFCFRIPFDATFRLFAPALGGGALLDVGVYPLALAQMVYGAEPTSVKTHVNLAATGVDEQAVMTLHYANGAMASLACASRVAMPQEALIAGTSGYIRIPERFSQPDALVLVVDGKEERLTFPRTGYGYHLEIEAATRCIAEGALECGVATHAASLSVANTADRIRKGWGLRYPNELAVWPPVPADP